MAGGHASQDHNDEDVYFGKLAGQCDAVWPRHLRNDRTSRMTGAEKATTPFIVVLTGIHLLACIEYLHFKMRWILNDALIYSNQMLVLMLY